MNTFIDNYLILGDILFNVFMIQFYSWIALKIFASDKNYKTIVSNKYFINIFYINILNFIFMGLISLDKNYGIYNYFLNNKPILFFILGTITAIIIYMIFFKKNILKELKSKYKKIQIIDNNGNVKNEIDMKISIFKINFYYNGEKFKVKDIESKTIVSNLSENGLGNTQQYNTPLGLYKYKLLAEEIIRQNGKFNSNNIYINYSSDGDYGSLSYTYNFDLSEKLLTIIKSNYMDIST